MRIFRELPKDFGPCVAAIGNFDGVHRGHQWILQEVIRRGQELHLPSLAITFDPHPARVLRPEVPFLLITPLSQKLELLAASGVENIAVLPFTEEFSRLSARAFACEILCDAFHVKELHEGENFRFGRHADGRIEDLAEFGRELGFELRVYSPRIVRRAPISSSRIRHAISAGEVGQARAFLGRLFAIESHAAPGRGYGTRYTVPTINLAPYSDLLPANGVYITTLTVGDGSFAETFNAVTNVGNRPTFGEDSFTVESHLLNFHPIDLQPDTPLALTFLKRLRAEMRWPAPGALREQIGRDIQRASRYFSLCQTAAQRREGFLRQA